MFLWVGYFVLITITLVFANFTIYRTLGFLTIILCLVLIGLLVYLGLRLLAAIPRRFAFVLIVPLPMLALALTEFWITALLALIFGGMMAAVVIAASVASIYRSGFHPKTQKATLSTLIVALFALVFTTYQVFLKYEDPNPALAGYQLPDRTLDLPDPSITGEHGVLFTTYGSGTDLHRTEFGTDVGFTSTAVDGSKLVDNWEKTIGWARSQYWGFAPDALPVQGRVWYPDGVGPFPLILIVHGNHGMEDFSDPGYEYLGQLLASRGYIVSSVDENFLNSSIADFVYPIKPGLEEENDARGWMLLEHLKQWRKWNSEVNHVFFNKVDINNISLIGHSRGGEAVAVASYFNDLGYYPDDASLSFDYHFNIKGIIAIAPSDGQYKPRSNSTPVTNSSYFSIHGSMDGDVNSFMGLSQFSRVSVNKANQFSAVLYVHGANHGQFNTSWGDQDTLLGWGLNKAPIMPASDQRKIAEVYFSAFLDILHKGRTEYQAIFSNAAFAHDWLPETFFINNYRQPDTQWLMNFEEDGDLASGTLTDSIISSSNLSRWNEDWTNLKWNPLESHVANIAWDEKYHDNASFGMSFANTLNVAEFNVLVFSVSQSTDNSLPKNFEPPEEDETDTKTETENIPTSLDWTIVLVDSEDNESRVLLSDVDPLYPQVKQDTQTAQFDYRSAQSEVVLKHYAFALRDFSATGDFNGELKQIRFVFDQSDKGSIILDDVGLTRLPWLQIATGEGG